MPRSDDPIEQAIANIQDDYATEDRLAVESAIKSLLSAAIGRKFLWRVLQLGKVGTQPYTSSDRDTAFQCGELNVGNGVLALITEADPAGYLMMQQENIENGRARTNRINDARRALDSSSGNPGGDPN
jgi:hypothetical protein